jgi:tetratricopeptide (TPR) repeat protein/tRNA A-37 threonylcarbamoyl transferase component Bud32
MADSFSTVDEPLSVAEELHVNDVCDRFEAAWRAAGPGAPGPRIEDYLGDAPEPGRSALLRHLLQLEIDYRVLRGERPAASDYESRFPSLSARFLARALPAGTVADSPAVRRAAGGDGEGTGPSTVSIASFEPRLRSDRYVHREFYARGGIGEVWKADDVEIGRLVALKRLRRGREEQQERFLVEAQITGQLAHPGVVPVHDLGVDQEGRPFYVMAFVHGRTLREAIEEYHAGRSASGEPPEVQAGRLLEAFIQVCQTVAYAHNRGVVHRDLKPDNVRLGRYGETIVLDWGMAKVRDHPEQAGDDPPVHLTGVSGSTETRDGAVLGSPVYMAPEMAEGRAADADERTDVYLLGATLYHVLTGQAPRRGNSFEEIVELARTVPPTPPRKLRADVSRALEAICLKAMAHRPGDRYATPLELADDVRRYLAGAPVSAYREPLPARAWRWCKRHRHGVGRSLAAALALGLVLAGGSVVREAWEREAALRREAEELRRCDQARRDLDLFRRLAEGRQFDAADTTPAGERPLHQDGRRAEAAGERAIEVAERLSKDMEPLPLVDERNQLHGELHDLLLLTVQARVRQPLDRGAVPPLLERLDRAAALRGPSAGYHRLRAACYRALGDAPRAAEEVRRAREAKPTALDYFLQAEQYRARATAPAEAPGEGVAWRPNPELLKQAITRYEKALRLQPDHYWSHFQLGRCYLSLGRGTEAVEALNTCVALRPLAPWGYSARGLALGLTLRFREGEADLAKALACAPGFRPALLNRGLLSWLQKKYDGALADFGQVLEPPADQRLIEAAYYRGQLQLERGQWPEALKDFDLVVKENPGFRPVYLSRAQVHFLRGDDVRGLADLTTFLDLARPAPLDPNDPRAFARRGRLLLDLAPRWGLSPRDLAAKLRLARDQLEAARQRGRPSPELLSDLGFAQYQLGQAREALTSFAQALQAAPPELRVKAHVRRGWIYLELAQEDRAREEFGAALRLEPGNAEAHSGLGYLQARRELPADAQRAAAGALLHGGGDYRVLHNVACIYAELSRSDRPRAEPHQVMAVALIRRSLELARQAGRGPEELGNVAREPSFGPLRERADFRNLIAGEGMPSRQADPLIPVIPAPRGSE